MNFDRFNYTNTTSLESKNLAILRHRSNSEAALTKEDLARRRQRQLAASKRKETKHIIEKMDAEKMRSLLLNLVERGDSYMNTSK